ncbi:hypothetical protein B0T16DRAFT_458984 [Cercophora newfieldiana]|uniref:NACHT domain-containing protein n=1 Tax=Cercophora newfieldiana TaxID=92897 RepID=A0AA40CRU2_9PEZI|nr:hypothetical protein B0T16DRAFT_458984 [Cercophora newfieldiana]
MDPLSIGASVLAFVGLTDKIIRATRFCIDGLKDAPSDIRLIFCEVSSLRTIVDILTGPDSDGETAVESVVSTFPLDWAGPIEACRRCLEGLETLLPSVIPGAFNTGSTTASRRRITLAELAWPLKQSKARKLLAEISQHKATLLLAISGDIIHELRDIKAGLQRVETVVSDSERRDICQWLERTNPSSLHNAALRTHEPHTSEWLQRSPEWQGWVSSASSDRLLWIYGIPGAGKTVLASFAIEQLKRLCDDAADRACAEYSHAYYYCHYSHNQDEALPFLAWTISQVCRQTERVPQRLKRLRDSGCEPTIPELEHVLELALRHVERLYVVVDAIDESMPREGLVRLLATMARDSRFPNVRILATSRQYLDIERVFSGVSVAISMANPYVDADVGSFVRARLKSSYRLRRWESWLPEIEKALVLKAQGMFRWVDCQIQAIERLRDPEQLPEALENLPRDLNETYIRIFEAIPEPDRQFVRHVLVWIVGDSWAPWLVSRGINAGILVEAVAYDLHGPRRPLFDFDYFQELCGCLITVESNVDDRGSALPGSPRPTTPNDGDMFVSLAHYTVLEFLTSPRILQTPVYEFAISEADIEHQFGISVLRQALAADPDGAGTDWARDREAYCLTLGCALNEGLTCLDSDHIRELFVRYIDPSQPHYRRFRGIQERAARSRKDGSGFFRLRRLPAEFVCTPGDGERQHAARILYNLLLLQYQPGQGMEQFLPFILQGSLETSRIGDLLETKVSGMIIDSDSEAEGDALVEVHFDDEVQHLLESESSESSRPRAPAEGEPMVVDEGNEDCY